MSNLHVNLDEANKHTPKGFDNVGNNTRPWKDEQSASTYTENFQLPRAINFVDGTLAAPSNGDGDIFVLTGSGTLHADWGTAAAFQDWVRFTNTIANPITPLAGALCYDDTASLWKEFDGSVWDAFGGVGATGGVFGITDAAGVYTYYVDFPTAHTAASNGDVIELFTNITTAVPLGISKDITLNGNGYTIDNTATGYTIDNAAVDGVNYYLTNIKITSTLGKGILVDRTATNLKADDSVYIDTYENALVVTGASSVVKSGNFTVTRASATPYAVTSSGGEIVDLKIKGRYGASLVGATMRNCYVDAVFTGVDANTGSTVHEVLSYSATGIGISNTSSVVVDCQGISNTLQGCVGGLDAVWYNTSALSFSSAAWGGTTQVQELNECVAYGLAGIGAQVKAVIKGGSFTSDGQKGIDFYGGTVNGAHIESKWNNSAGHAFRAVVAGGELSNCRLQVANVSAYCIEGWTSPKNLS